MVSVILLRCAACQKSFKYRKTANVVKKFCVPCTKKRNATGKIKFRIEDRARKKESKNERVEQERALKNIPDRDVHIDKFFNLLGRIA